MMTEKMRVSASSVMSNVADTSAMPARWRADGAARSPVISVIGGSVVHDQFSSRICRRVDRVGGAAAARALRRVAAGAGALLVRAGLCRVRCGTLHLPSVARAVVSLVVGAVAGLCTVHRDLRRGGRHGNRCDGPAQDGPSD